MATKSKKQPAAALTSAEATKKFMDCFNRLAYTRSYADALNMFVDYSLWFMNLWVVNEITEDVARWDKTVNAEEGKMICEMLFAMSVMSDNNGEGFKDAIGQVFMEHVSHGKAGQFFTPDHVCDLMAMLTMQEVLEEHKDKDVITVSDPACGSGQTLLSAAKHAGREKVRLYGADIDLLCCKMAVLNMMLNTVQGEVHWMDSLSMEHWGGMENLQGVGRDSLRALFYQTRARP